MNRIFSGIQPTNNAHLGNYLGAIRNWVRLQDAYECIYCVVDLHAITLWQEPDELRANTRELAATLIACGIDPEKNVLFNQSLNRDHAELAWIFNCVARLGWMNRMTQFKEKAGKHRENASVGLYVYPTLMAADILAYKATHVPVGDDQKQHLELCRDIAQKFNHDFKQDVFPLTEPLILGEATRVMSLRDGTAKMSKSETSDLSRINLHDDADTIAHKIRRARTDPNPLPDHVDGFEGRPEAENLVTIYGALSDQTKEQILQDHAGAPFSAFKETLTERLVATLEPIGQEMRRLMQDPAAIDATLVKGGDKAAEMSAPVLAEVREIVGFVRR